jgi:hypothetical protein
MTGVLRQELAQRTGLGAAISASARDLGEAERRLSCELSVAVIEHGLV